MKRFIKGNFIMGRKRFKKWVLFIFSILSLCSFLKIINAESQTTVNKFSTLNAKIVQNEQHTNLTVDIFTPVSDNVSKVLVPIWHDDSQDDIYWYPAKKISAGHYQVEVEHWRHKFHEGIYHIHVYEYKKNNELSAIALNDVELKKDSPIVSINIQNVKEEKGEAEVRLDVQTTQKIQKIYVPVWCAENQSDIKWYQAEKQDDGSYLAKINISNHHYHRGLYKIHTYVYLQNNNEPVFVVGNNLLFNEYADELTAITENYNNKMGSIDIRVHAKSIYGINKVYVPVWSKNDQSDIKWYEGERQSDGSYLVHMKIGNHAFNRGSYHMHVYAYNGINNFKAMALNDITFTPIKDEISAKIINQDNQNGKLKIRVDVISDRKINKIYVPIWSRVNQSDIKWYEGVRQTDGSYQVEMSISNHKYHLGPYHIHIYGYLDNLKSPIFNTLPDFEFKNFPDDLTAEVFNFNNDSGTFDVRVHAKSLYGVRQVYVPVWTTKNQDDIKWYLAQLQNDGSYLAHINIKNHKYHRDPYHIHVYEYNGLNQAKAIVLDDVTFTPFPDKLSANVVQYNDRKGTMTVKVNAFSEKGIDRVYVPIWSTANQSDIKWYQAQLQSDGSYQVEMNIANHQYHRGLYHVHVYAYNLLHESKAVALQDVQFNQYQDKISGSINSVNQVNGSFKVLLNLESYQGIKNVRVPIWHRDNQSDIKWYEAKKINENTFEVTFNVGNHNYETGTYHVHAYLTNYSNKEVGTIVGDVNLSGDYQQRVLSVPYYNQNAWGAPVGCEGVALLQALQAKGYAKQYNPRSFLNEIPHSTDGTPYTGFVGSPFIANNWQFTAIFDQALTRWGQRYGNVSNISGSSTSQLLDQIWQGNPVVTYVTVHMTPLAWGIWQFGRVPNNNHAVTLSGFNKHNGTVFVTDPIDGQYWMSASKFASIYEARKMAVVVR